MRSQKAIWTACALALAIYVSRGNSQTLQPPETTLDALHAMSQQAAIVFAGQVIAVRQSDGHSRATRFVEIDFAIDDAIRGVSGGIYTLREWAGLWQAGGALIPGQRYLMLLHPPGRHSRFRGSQRLPTLARWIFAGSEPVSPVPCRTAPNRWRGRLWCPSPS